MKRFLRISPLTVVLAAAIVAGIAIAATPALRVNGIKFGSNDLNVTVIQFGAKCDGVTDDAAAFNAAMLAVYNAGGGSVFVPAGTCRIPWSTPVVMPGNLTLYGVKGQSTIKAITTGSPPVSPTFPSVGGALFVSGNPTNSQRYLTQTGRVASGTGATFNLTASGGAITVATVVAGGTGYKVGDLIGVGNGTILTVATVTSYRGPVATVNITTPGSGWGTPSNPVAQVSSTGEAIWDRVLDPATIGGPIHIRDLIFDGNYGGGGSNAQLTGSQFYEGVHITGHSLATVENCEFKNFANDGLQLFDVRRGVVINNYFENNGWLCVAGTTCNAVSNDGIYVTTNAGQLNTDSWKVANNRIFATGDVPIEYHWITGDISNNTIWDFGSIAIEGQASGFDTSGETFANNGGVVIPSDILVQGNVVDGTRSLTSSWTTHTPGGSTVPNLSYGVDGLSLAAGNQGVHKVSHNIIKNLIRLGIWVIQGSKGKANVTSNDLYSVGMGNANVTTLPVNEFQTDELEFKLNKLMGNATNPMGTTGIYLNGQGSRVDISENEFDQVGFATPLVFQQWFGAGQLVRYFRFSKNVIQDMYSGLILELAQNSSANTAIVQDLEISENQILNTANLNSSYATVSPFQFITSSSGTLDFTNIRIQGNVFSSNRANHLDSTTPVFYFNNSSISPSTWAEFRNNLTQGFTLYKFDTNTTAPTALVVSNGITNVSDSLTTTQKAGVSLQDTTAATAGAVKQYSPGYEMVGQAWNTGSLASQTEKWLTQVQPTSGASIGGNYTFYSSENGGAYTLRSFIDSSGDVVAIGQLYAGSSGNGQLNAGNLAMSATSFASLGTPANGTIKYCSDCTIANPCAGSGTGALAKRLNGAWVCN